MNETTTPRLLVDQLRAGRRLSLSQWQCLLQEASADDQAYAMSLANQRRRDVFGDAIYIRGLIEFTNYCRCDCKYCGLQASNKNVQRYRLMPEHIIPCVEQGYAAGFRTIVLQGGEDSFFTDARLCQLVRDIKARHADMAVTLSVGERSRDSYAQLRDAGTDRYLLRHETATPEHYALLHPPRQQFANRMRCLHDLQELGYQVGCGFMVGSPGQTLDHLAQDLAFIQDFRPHMVGIGPFIPHHDTPFRQEPAGSVEQTLFALALVRLALPSVLLPATTALATLHPQGRQRAILAGANVVMPNLTPPFLRDNYSLYDHKANTGAEAAEGLRLLRQELQTINCHIAISRGDAPDFT